MREWRPDASGALREWREHRRLRKSCGAAWRKCRELNDEAAKLYLDGSKPMEEYWRLHDEAAGWAWRARLDAALAEGEKWLAKAMLAAARSPSDRNLKGVRYRTMDLEIARKLHEWGMRAVDDGEPNRAQGCCSKMRAVTLHYADPPEVG